MIKKTAGQIKRFFTYIWTHKKKPRVFIPVIIAVLLVLFGFSSDAKTGTYGIYALEPKAFVQEVSVTGKVVPAQKVDMSFESSGRISKINTTVGAKVKTGQLLASLSNADYYANLQKSQASYAGEQAKLSEIQRGNRPEEIAIAKADYQVSIQNVSQARLAVIEEIKDAYSEADNAVKNDADQVFRNARGVNPELIFFIENNSNLKRSLEEQRLKITESFVKWQVIVARINADTLTDADVDQSKVYALQVQTFLNDLNTAINSVNESLASDSRYIAYRADISSARTSVNAAVQSLNTSLTNLRNANSSSARAQEELALKQSGSTKEEIAAAKANAQGAAASVSNASASLGKTLITAPFDGIVTRVQYKVGESVTQSDPVITVMSDSAFEIETFVSENDAPKLTAGLKAKVTLDALGEGVVFDAVVSQVDLSETIKDGVVSYKTRLQFLTNDTRIKSGLTSNVVIETDRRENVLKVPQTAIVISKGKKYVKVVPAGTTEWNKTIDGQATLAPVTTGAIDKEGDIEILSGVQVGDIVIVRVSESNAAATE